MKRLLLLFFLFATGAWGQGACPTAIGTLDQNGNPVTLAQRGITKCFYISTSGSDSNTGTTESSPWAHSPGMANCTATCASAPKGPGTGYIFKNGDTWTGSDVALGMGQTSSLRGSSWNAPIYWGAADPNWGSGNRAIFDCQSGLKSVAWGGGGNVSNWIILDNIEIKNWRNTATSCNPAVIKKGSNYTEAMSM